MNEPYCEVCRNQRNCKSIEKRGPMCSEFDTFLDDESFSIYSANQLLAERRQNIVSGKVIVNEQNS